MSEIDTNKVRVVTLAGGTYVVKRVPMARIKRIDSILTSTVQELRKDVNLENVTKDPEAAAGLVSSVMDKILAFPHAILSIFIDELPVEIFLDDENGVDLPDFLDALKAALELNRTDVLKKGFSRLFSTLIETQRARASISQRTS